MLSTWRAQAGRLTAWADDLSDGELSEGRTGREAEWWNAFRIVWGGVEDVAEQIDVGKARNVRQLVQDVGDSAKELVPQLGMGLVLVFVALLAALQ